MRNLFLTLIATLLVCGQLFSQKDPMKWGNVPEEDLTMTQYEPDPSAGAVVLCDFGEIVFNTGGLRFVRHKRVKILNRSGFDQADVVIPFNEDQRLINFKAQSIAPDA